MSRSDCSIEMRGCQPVDACVRSDAKPPWFIDLLNINLNNHDLDEAGKRVRLYLETLSRDGRRITGNLDFDGSPA